MTAASRRAFMGSARRPLPVGVRELAGRLAGLFERDVEIVKGLNDTQRRLRDANERLWSGLAPDAFGLVYDGVAPAGVSPMAKLIEDALCAGAPESRAVVLGALAQTHWAIHRAFCEFGSACEERRRLAVEVGEVSQQLTELLCAAGWSAEEARDANVHELAAAGIR
jgi:hypothetical protein